MGKTGDLVLLKQKFVAYSFYKHLEQTVLVDYRLWVSMQDYVIGDSEDSSTRDRCN